MVTINDSYNCNIPAPCPTQGFQGICYKPFTAQEGCGQWSFQCVRDDNLTVLFIVFAISVIAVAVLFSVIIFSVFAVTTYQTLS